MKNYFFNLILSVCIICEIIFSQSWYVGYLIGVVQPTNFRSLSFVDSLNGFASTYNGYLHKTTDGGKNWLRFWIYSKEFETIQFNTRSKGWCVTWDGKIFYTINSGFQWTEATISGNPINSRINSFQMIDDNYGFLGTQNGYIYKTTNGGRIWFLSFAPASAVWGISFINTTTGWAATWRDTVVYKTTNNGVSWSPLGSVPYPNGDKRISFIDSLNGWMTVQSGNIGTVLRTTDGGVSWEVKKTGNHYYRNILVESPTNVWTCGDLYGLFYTSDGGETWQQKSTANSNAISRLSNGHLILAGSNHISYSKNNGFAFSQANTVFYNNFSAVLTLNGTEAMCVGNKGAVIHTTNSGTNWKWANPDFQTNLNCITRIPNSTIFVGGDYGNVFTTGNVFTWQNNYIGFNESVSAIEYDGSGKIYVGTAQGTLLNTTNSGSSWNFIYKFTNEKITDLLFINKNILFVTTASGNIYKTNTSGEEWMQSLHVNYQLKSITSAHPLTIIAAGMGSKMYRTHDTGSTWIPIQLAIPENSTIHKVLMLTSSIGTPDFCHFLDSQKKG